MAKGKTPARSRSSQSHQTTTTTTTHNLSVSGEGEGEASFAIGDFVWAKTKSYPWWPAKVYDPSHAAPDIVKLRRDKHCALVDYFGADGRCAWCEPHQLKLFGPDFSHQMSHHSRPSFLHAVGEALDDIGRVLEEELTCHCSSPSPSSHRSKAQPKSRNYSPTEFLRLLRRAAADVSTADLLQSTMLQSWVTALQKLRLRSSSSSHSGRSLAKLVTSRPTRWHERLETTKILAELRRSATNPWRSRWNLLGKTVRDFFVRYRRSMSAPPNSLHLRNLKDSGIAETKRSKGKRKAEALKWLASQSAHDSSCRGRADDGERVWMGEASLDAWTPFVFKITDRSKEGGYLTKLSKGEVAALVGCSEMGGNKRIKDEPCSGTLINNGGSNNGHMMMDTDKNESGSQDPAALFLAFDSSVPVPSTDEVISTFSKFGDLIEVETLSLSEGGCARVSFVSSRAAERAFNNRHKIGGFGSLVMSYHLCR